MTEEKKEEKKEAEIVDKKVIEADIGDTIIEGDKLFVVEEVSDEKDTEPDKKKGIKAEESEKEPDKSDKIPSGDEKFVITESMQVKMLEKKISKMDKELVEASYTPDQIRKRVPLSDLKADIDRQRSLLSNIDKSLNPDEWASQNRMVTTLEGDIAEKKSDAELEKRFASKDNTDFLKDEKKLLADKGFEFSDEQFDGIAAAAEDYLTDGKYTRESIRKGLIDIIGADATDKIFEVSSEQKIRGELKDATKKETKSVRITSKGISAKLVPFSKRLIAITEPDELEAELDKLSPEEFAIYERDLKKQKK